MAAIVTYDTIPELFSKLFAHFDGYNRTVLRYKDKQSKAWIDITWEELQERVQAMMGYLHQSGIRAGDRVAILSENRPEWAIADIATQMIGAVNVSLYTSLPAPQVSYIIKDSGSKMIVVSTGIQQKKAEQILADCPELTHIVSMNETNGNPAVVNWADALASGAAYYAEHEAELMKLGPAVRPEDLSALIYTSGTTGNPKGVMLTHHNFSTNAQAATDFVSFHSEDHHLSFLPLCHSFERTGGYIAVLSCGAKITYAESIDTVSRNLEEVHPTVLISVPRVFEKVYNAISKSVEEGSQVKKGIFHWAVETGKQVAALKRAGKQPGLLLRSQQNLAHRLVFSKLYAKLGGNLRFAVSGGAALPANISEFFQAAQITVIEGYGLTETAPILCVNPLEEPRSGMAGMVLPGITVGIKRVGDGKLIGKISGEDYPTAYTLTTPEGEIVAKGPNIMMGYWGHDEDTKACFDEEGWFHTGDVGHFVGGYLKITDRIKHMIVSAGGKNVYPGPIEEAFKSFIYIDQIIVLGEGREFLTALVVPNFDNLKAYATEKEVPFTDETDLVQKPEILSLFDQEFKTYSKTAAAPEKIRAFRLLAEPFTIENTMMTPSLKLRRRVIEKHYADLINEMYAG